MPKRIFKRHFAGTKEFNQVVPFPEPLQILKTEDNKIHGFPEYWGASYIWRRSMTNSVATQRSLMAISNFW